MNKPTFIHDCKKCVFLGSVVFEEQLYDLYVCSHKDKEIDTVVARYGDEGREYGSGVYFRDTIPPLGEAYRRAVALGYKLKKEDER